MGAILAKGVRWNSNRLNEVPQGMGVIVVFDEDKKTFDVQESEDMIKTLRMRWWKHSFWFFSWFQTAPPEFNRELKQEIEKMSYEEAWDYK